MAKSKMHHTADGKKFEYARMLRQAQTHAEELMWQELRNRKLGVKFRRQHPISDYVVDFYCSDKSLIVEIDGAIHNDTEIEKKDKEREDILISLGYRILRFTNDEVENDIFKVLKSIRNEISN